VPASLLSEFGGVGGYENKARIRGRGQENDPDLDTIHVPYLGQVEEHRQDRYSTDDRR